MLSELFASVSAKVVAASFAAVTTVGTGAAATTGNLPDDLQDGVSQAAASVGIDLPDSGQDISAEDVRQDDGRQDDERGDTGDDTLDTLSDVDPTEDGEGFGEDVSDKATTDGEGLGEDVSGTASDGAADEGQSSTTGDDASTTGDDAAAEESDSGDEYPESAPSDSGDQEASDSGPDSNPGDENRE